MACNSSNRLSSSCMSASSYRIVILIRVILHRLKADCRIVIAARVAVKRIIPQEGVWVIVPARGWIALRLGQEVCTPNFSIADACQSRLGRPAQRLDR